MNSISDALGEAIRRPVDNTEYYAQHFDRLAASIRRHGVVDGELSMTAEKEDLDPIERDGVKFRNYRPTGRMTYTMNLTIDQNQVR
jgi:hypothetical protein